MDIPEQLLTAHASAGQGAHRVGTGAGALLFSTDPRCRIRLMQWLVSALAYTASGFVLWFGMRLGWMDATRLVPWCVFLATGLAGVYVALRSGWSERFSDPALTVPQLLLGVMGVEWGYLICGPVRSVALFPLLLIFTFAAFSLSWRKIAVLTLVALLSLLVTIVALHVSRGGMHAWSLYDPDLRLDITNFLMISIMLPALSSLAARLSSMRMRLHSQRHALTGALQEVQRLATHDALTGLCNRRYMEQRLAEEQSRCQRQALPFSIALIDLDHFKRINDTRSHAVGDEVLRVVAGILEHGAERVEEGLAVRMGGEEFLVLLPGVDRETGIKHLETLRQELAAYPWAAITDGIAVTASIGVAVAPSDGVDRRAILEVADQNLYRAKHSGRDRVVC